ncbi:unnamed protein product [Tilletia laevis]|uniref:DUF6589 domain-containing protein n=1 Tax=Tilletia laevis TaxID=157183 RepID=A0A9N8QLA8_9BASI|nr:unnamed protein product [Tilletia caries]CAD6957961.1 unnamed protein product [Tilletia laevis]CAD6962825.1 unnamed protein product [Tilletia laevis]
MGHELATAGETIDDWNPDTKTFFDAIDRLYENHLTQNALFQARDANDNDRATSILFMRDCVVGLEYAEAIKAGDLGRMAEVEKPLCLSFYGAGQTKYGSLLLDRALIDREQPVVAKTLRAAQLVNLHGRKNGWQGADLYQEQLNRRLLMFHPSQSPNHTAIRYEDRMSAFVGLGQRLVAKVQRSLDMMTDSRHKKSEEEGMRGGH